MPDAPIIFSKVPECVIAPGAAIEIDPAASSAIDYEAELAIVIGKGGRGIKKADALKHVWGCTIVNDVTARDLQGKYKAMDHRQVPGHVLPDGSGPGLRR